MTVEISLATGKLVTSLLANGLVFLVIPMTKESAQCMSDPIPHISNLTFAFVYFKVLFSKKKKKN